MWLVMARVTAEDRRYLAILGRALFVCQRIETTMKWFLQGVKMSAVHTSGKPIDLEKITEYNNKLQLGKRLREMVRFASEGSSIAKDMKNFEEVLHAAIISRNFVAHESVALSSLSARYASEEEIAKDNNSASVRTEVPQRLALLKMHLENLVRADEQLSILSFQMQERRYHLVPDYQKSLLRWIMTGRVAR